MASRTQWTWVWVNFRSWWFSGRPGVLRFMGSQGVRHDWATELNWTEIIYVWKLIKETSTNITFGKAWRGNSHSLSLTHLPYHSFADLNKKKCNLHMRPEVTLFYYPSGQRKISFLPSNQFNQQKNLQLSKKLLSPWTLLSSSEFSFFFCWGLPFPTHLFMKVFHLI